MTSTSSYLEHLPAIFSDEAIFSGEDGAAPFAGRFLLAFEKLLSGLGDPGEPGLEEILEGIRDPGGGVLLAGTERYFTPGPGLGERERAPAEFLEWLAGWVALARRDGWSEEQERRVLSRIVPLYAARGTRDGVREALALFTGLPSEAIEIVEHDASDVFQLDVTSTLGRDSRLGGGTARAFHFEVRIPLAEAVGTEGAIRAILDQEKPAHTTYDLDLGPHDPDLGARMRIEVNSTIDVDTVLGP